MSLNEVAFEIKVKYERQKKIVDFAESKGGQLDKLEEKYKKEKFEGLLYEKNFDLDDSGEKSDVVWYDIAYSTIEYEGKEYTYIWMDPERPDRKCEISEFDEKMLQIFPKLKKYPSWVQDSIRREVESLDPKKEEYGKFYTVSCVDYLAEITKDNFWYAQSVIEENNKINKRRNRRVCR